MSKIDRLYIIAGWIGVPFWMATRQHKTKWVRFTGFMLTCLLIPLAALAFPILIVIILRRLLINLADAYPVPYPNNSIIRA